MKKVLCLVLTFVILLTTTLPALAVTPADPADSDTSGYCGYYGDNLRWNVDDSGVLTISGNGKMKDYSDYETPWFAFHDTISQVVFDGEITSIGASAFNCLSALEEIAVPDSVTEIGDGAFLGCQRLFRVSLPETLDKMGSGTFAGCSSLTTLKLPTGITSLNDTFDDCTNLRNIVIPEGVTAIEDGAFKFCSFLQWIYVPASLTSIGEETFWSSSLKHIYYAGSETDWEKTDNRIDMSNGWNDGFANAEIHYNAGAPEQLTVSSGKCGENAGYSIDAYGALTVSGDGAMYDYAWGDTPWKDYKDGLISVTIEDGISSIGSFTFTQSSVSAANLPKSILKIGNGAFMQCGRLRSIAIPANCTEIGPEAFDRCGALKTIEVDKDNPCYYCEGNCLIEKDSNTVLRGCGNSVIPQNVTAIGDCAFSECRMKTITIPSTVTVIGNEAFSGCSDLDYMEIPDGIERLGEHLFAHTSLKKIYIPRSVMAIEEGAFYCEMDPGNTDCPLSGGYALSDIYYEGTEEEWNNVAINRENNRIIVFTIVAGEDGTATPKELTNANEAIDCCTIHYNSVASVASDGLPHVPGETTTTVLTEPTCTEKGKNKETTLCAVCDTVITEEIVDIPAVGHQPVIDDAVAATCTEDGKTEGSHCGICGEILTAQTTIKATGHEWDEGKVTTEPTQTKEGVKTFTCTVCGETRTEPVDKLPTEPDDPTEPEKPAYTPGDVDGDGKITSADARLALRRSVMLEDYPEGSAAYLACDVDHDGKVTSADARLILRGSVGLEDVTLW